MKCFAELLFATILTCLLCAPAMAGDKLVVDGGGTPQYLYVMSAANGKAAHGKLTLEGVPGVVYFSDRPNRIAGHMSLKQFMTMWGAGANDLQNDPPNATLSILDGSTISNVVVTLTAPRHKNDTATFTVKPIQGKLPAAFGQASLFIDYGDVGIGMSGSGTF